MTAQIIPFPAGGKVDLQLSDAMLLCLSSADPRTGRRPKRNPIGHLYPMRVIRALYWRGLVRREARRSVAGIGLFTWVNDSDYSAEWFITEIGRQAVRMAQREKRA
ncbi:MAG TPA: hypothetical protein VM639_24490 [Dongiaceae bacterium]|nr:hypothetical protein [Dongiaceae bacterium]